MELTAIRNTPEVPPSSGATSKGVHILARSLFRQMRSEGYTTEQIIGLSSALIELVREDLSRDLPAE